MKNHFTNLRGRGRACLCLLAALCCLLIYASSASAQTYYPGSTMTGTPAAGTYYNSGGITLTNFSFTASSGNSLRLFITPCVPLSASLSGTQNYISTIVPRIAGFTTSSSLSSPTACQATQTIQYMDGLGRPMQTVQVKGNPNASKDVIIPQAYDEFGRENKKYLPYTTTSGNPGSYRGDALAGSSGYSNSGQMAFYGTSGQNYKDMAHPFAETGFEPSPLNRVLEQGAPGDAWQLTTSGITGSGHTVKTTYTTNNDTLTTDTARTRRVALYTATINSNGTRTLARAGNNAIYTVGELTCTVTRDENTGLSSRGGSVEEYKDKQGHVVLKRVYNKSGNTLQALSTYYVYDDLDLLAFVLPPGAMPDSTWTPNQTTLDNLCYQYRYDERNRLVKKKLPGQGWERMVYNKLDQLVLSQDSVQYGGNKWTVTKYDALGRVILTGVWNAGSEIAQGTLQTSIYAAQQWDDRDVTHTAATYPTGYVIGSYPSTLNDILTINYYDDYSLPNLPSAYDQHSSYSAMTRGLNTASKAAILNTDGTISTDMLWQVHYYDDRGRNVRSFRQHYLAGVISNYNYDDVSTRYDFTGAVTNTVRLHYTKNSGNTAAILALTLTDSLEYDHMGRQLNHLHKLNSGDYVALSKQEYNEVGQLYKKRLGSSNSGNNFAQNVAYGYNERGWIRTANSSLFNMELQYETPSTGKQYNGNISNQVWTTSGQSQKTYVYKYDNLNRLLEGKAGAYQERGISYDVMGNIKTLSRVFNNTLIDSLSYNYLVSGNPTNQLQQLTDATSYDDGLKHGDHSYSYDLNGNMYADVSKGLNVYYNMLNLPRVNTLNAGTISYIYDASGQKLRKVNSIDGTTTDYINGIQYNGSNIDFVQTGEGRLLNPTTGPSYEYTLADHLGNTRVTFDATGTLKQADDYLPFGMETAVVTPSVAKNNYLYNNKELQAGLGLYDYGARLYDPVIGRWTSVDPLAEDTEHLTPYNYGGNNPILMMDPDGMATDSVNKQKPELSPVQLPEVVIRSGPHKGLVAITVTPWLGNYPSHIEYRLPQAALEANRTQAIAFLNKYTEIGATITIINSLLNINKELKFSKTGTPRQKSAKQLRKEWEKATGKKWPKEPGNPNRNQVAHHIKPLADGGEDGYPNIEPKPASEHTDWHRLLGDFVRWGSRRIEDVD